MKKIFSHKFFILGVLTLIIFNNLISPIYEGLEDNSQTDPKMAYVFLAPPKNTNISAQQWNLFAKKFNISNQMISTSSAYIDELNAIATPLVQSFLGNVSIEEYDYYMQYGYFPWCTYVSDHLLKTPNMRTIYPNRIAYHRTMETTDAAQTPIPEALKIYIGQIPAPQLPSFPLPPQKVTRTSTSPPNTSDQYNPITPYTTPYTTPPTTNDSSKIVYECRVRPNMATL